MLDRAHVSKFNQFTKSQFSALTLQVSESDPLSTGDSVSAFPFAQYVDTAALSRIVPVFSLIHQVSSKGT